MKLKIQDQDNIIKVLDEYDMPEVPKSSYSTLGHIGFQIHNAGISHDLTVKRVSNYWLIEASVEKVQPQNIALLYSCLYIGAIQSVNFAIEASIYSDNLPEPATKRLIVNIESKDRDVTLSDIEELERERFVNSKEYKKFLKRHTEKHE